jgi:hypothetical protein
MANRKPAKSNTIKAQPEKSPKVDPLTGKRFMFTLDNKPHSAFVESKISPGVYLVRVLLDNYGYVLSVSQMGKLDVVFEPEQ